MKTTKHPSEQLRAPGRTPRKRFRIERLEERIAPKKGGKGTHNCGSSLGDTGGTGTSGY